MAFTSLAYLIDIDWLKEAYRRTRKDGAVTPHSAPSDACCEAELAGREVGFFG